MWRKIISQIEERISRLRDREEERIWSSEGHRMTALPVDSPEGKLGDGRIKSRAVTSISMAV